MFAQLKDYLWGEGSGAGLCGKWPARPGHDRGGAESVVHRLRQRYRELLRAEVAHTVAAVHEIDEGAALFGQCHSGSNL